jgi:hypothetical protein
VCLECGVHTIGHDMKGKRKGAPHEGGAHASLLSEFPTSM